MLGNSDSLIEFASDATSESKVTGSLQLLQELRWRSGVGVLKANVLFFFEKDREKGPPILLLIIEDCFVQLGDDNTIGKEFTFELRFKTTGRTFVFAADSFKSLEQWVTNLSITPMDYIRLTKQSYLEQIETLSSKKSPDKEEDKEKIEELPK